MAGADGRCATAEAQKLPYCNTSLDEGTRVKDLVSRLPLSSKLALLQTTYDGNATLHGGGSLPKCMLASIEPTTRRLRAAPSDCMPPFES